MIDIYKLVLEQNQSKSQINQVNLKKMVDLERDDKILDFINRKDVKPTQTYVVRWKGVSNNALWATVLTIGYDKKHVVLRNPENIWESRCILMGGFLELTFGRIECNPLLCYCE
jgi:hypothetical protein